MPMLMIMIFCAAQQKFYVDGVLKTFYNTSIRYLFDKVFTI